MHEPEWTEEMQSKKQGDTTMQTCGWCKYQGCGTCRYNCMLEGHCSLLRSYDKVQWNTPCIVEKLGAGDKQALLSYKRWKIDEARTLIRRLKGEMDAISTRVSDEPKPCLAKNRSHDHFNIDDCVYVFHDAAWLAGVVANGYRHHDGCVSYRLYNYPQTENKPWGCGFAVPCILKRDEMEWFISHGSEAFAEWLDLQDVKYNGEHLSMGTCRSAFEVLAQELSKEE